MKRFINLLIAVELILFSFNTVLFSIQMSPSSAIDLALKQKQSEYIDQAEKLRLQGDYEKSIELFKKALALARKNNDKEIEVEALLKIGILYWNLGDLELTFNNHREAFSLAEKAKLAEKKEEINNFLQILGLYQAGKEYREKRQYQKSIENFENAINFAEKIKSEDYKLKCLRLLGVTYSELNDFNKLFSLSQEGLEIARRLRHKKEEGRSLYNIGLYYGTIDNYSQALTNYQKAREIAKILKEREDESECLTNISDIYIQTGDYEKALEYLEEVLEIDKQLKKDDYTAIDLNNIGVTYREKAFNSDNKADLDNALEYFKKSLEIVRKIKNLETEIEVLNNMGMVYADKGDYDQALTSLSLSLEKAEEVQDEEEIANICVNIGAVYIKKEDYDQSTKFLQKALDQTPEARGEILWEAYFEMGNAYKKLNSYQAAFENYKNSIVIIENIRSNIRLEELKASYLATDKRIEAYHNFVDLLYRLDRSEPEKLHSIQAFNYLERCKARTFLDRLEVSRFDIYQGVDIGLLNQENELKEKIGSLSIENSRADLGPERKESIEDELKVYKEQLEALRREIRISSPAYLNLNPEIVTLEQAQSQMLDHKTAFFEYCLGKENSYAFVITKKKLKIFPLPPLKEIRTLVKEYLTAITDKENQDFHLGYNLFCTLILPGLEKNIKKIIFIPGDILHYLPFETLLTEKDKRRWLVEDYKIAYAPSISSLREIIEREKPGILKAQKDILIFGDPFFGPKEEEAQIEAKGLASSDSSNFRRLKYSGIEIDRIAAFFKKKRIDVFKRKEATEEQLKRLNLNDYKILHFATHSLIDNKKPDNSSIVFALGNDVTEDGRLRMSEILNLKLNADLVTLSACETGLGQYIRGEGIEGLSRAFFYAGASSAIISLWAVHDQASSQFMERYYHYLRSARSIMDSLQKAKLELIGSEILSHPYYWAGFVAIGDSEKIISPSVNKKLILVILLLLLAGGIISFLLLKKLKPSFLA